VIVVARAVDLSCRIGSLRLPNPVLSASGTAGFGTELAPFVDLGRLGAVVVKSLSAEPWAGNPAPRIVPVEAGMLNSVGLDNPGVPAWLAGSLPHLASTGARVVVSLWGSTEAGYRTAATLLAEAVASGKAPGVVAVELNISCPNVERRAAIFAHSADSAAAAVDAAAGALRRSGLPVWAKLSPNVTDLTAIAGAVLDAGADGLTLVNTLMGLAIDPATGIPRLGGGGGGLSGPALHPVAVRAVHECRRAFPEVPIVGVGGVRSGVGAAELLVAGADAIQVGTATFADPRAPERVLAELRTWCAAHGIQQLAELRGRARAR
jgi:dihydroorotate dehydrogenase (NAD+) catalytic subunit